MEIRMQTGNYDRVVNMIVLEHSLGDSNGSPGLIPIRIAKPMIIEFQDIAPGQELSHTFRFAGSHAMDFPEAMKEFVLREGLVKNPELLIQENRLLRSQIRDLWKLIDDIRRV